MAEPTPTDAEIDQLGYASDEGGLKAMLELLDAISNAKTNGAAFAAVAKFRKHERIAAVKEALARWGAQPAHADSVLEDAARYDWLFGARTDAQVSSEISTVFNPLPQDEVISHLQGFYMSKSEVNALIDAARKQGANRG